MTETTCPSCHCDEFLISDDNQIFICADCGLIQTHFGTWKSTNLPAPSLQNDAINEGERLH